MSELFKCGRCGRVLISEEYEEHKCKISINGKITVIEADYWIEGKHPKTGEDLISAKALDGTTYWIIKRSLKPTDKLPFITSDENLQVKKSDGDLTEPEKIRIINLTTAKSLVKHYAAVFSGIIATLLFSGFVCQADAADLKALLVPSTNRTEASYIGVRTVTLSYPAGSSLAQMLDGENRRINFSLNGTTTAQDETGMSQAIGSINRALAEAKSPAQVSSSVLQYNAVIRGEPTRTLISYKVEIKPTLEKYVLSSDSSGDIIDLEWRGIVVNDAIVVNAPEIGEIDVNHALGLLQALYPNVAEKLASTQAKEILEEPILNFKVFDFPMASWHQLFDPVGTYGGGVGLQGTEGASVLSVYAYGEGSLREGVHTAEEKDVTVNIDGSETKVHSTTPPPSGQITVAGYSNEQESGGAEFALVTLDAPAGVQTSSGGFPIQVLLILGGMMGAVAIFVLLKARK